MHVHLWSHRPDREVQRRCDFFHRLARPAAAHGALTIGQLLIADARGLVNDSIIPPAMSGVT
jgi:hypothetical protein